MSKLSSHEVAKMIDQTLLKPFASTEDFRAFCKTSAEYDFKMVAINSAPVRKCKEFLKGSDVLVGAAIGFCLGQTTIADKVFETRQAILNGADEIDYVINIGELKSGNHAYIEKEMYSIVDVCREYNRTIKVIFENCYLTEDEKKKMCEIALKVKPDFIKTSTGFGTGGATFDDVRLMKSMVGNELQVKAAGGIRTIEDAKAMLAAGAARLGTSAGCAIVDAINQQGGFIEF